MVFGPIRPIKVLKNPTDPMENYTFINKNVQKYPKTLFLSAFVGFMCPKTQFYGSQKPQKGL